MALTVEQIAAAEDDKALFDLLAAELQRLLPEEVREDPEQYYATLSSMPPRTARHGGNLLLRCQHDHGQPGLALWQSERSARRWRNA